MESVVPSLLQPRPGSWSHWSCPFPLVLEEDQRPTSQQLPPWSGIWVSPRLVPTKKEQKRMLKRERQRQSAKAKKTLVVTLLSPSWWIYVVWFSRNHGVDRHPAIPGSWRIGSFGRLVELMFDVEDPGQWRHEDQRFVANRARFTA